MMNPAARALLLTVLLVFSGTVSAAQFNVFIEQSGTATRVGVVRLDAQFRLKVLSARKGRAAWLQQLADEVNAESALHLDAPPSPATPQFSDVTQIIPRGDPRFGEALREHLKRYYDASLRPVREP